MMPAPLPTEVAAEAVAVFGAWEDGPPPRVRTGANCVAVVGVSVVVRSGFSYPLRTATERACWAEARRAGVPAPEHLAAGVLPCGLPFQVYRCLHGGHPGDEASWTAVGRMAARLHRRARVQAFPTDPHPLPRRRNRYGIARESVGLLDLVPAQAVVAGTLISAAAAESGHPVPLHGDLRSVNILVSDGEVAGVLDWSDTHLGSAEAEWAAIPPSWWSAAWRGYRDEGGPRPDPRLAAGHALARVTALTQCGVLSSSAPAELLADLSAIGAL